MNKLVTSTLAILMIIMCATGQPGWADDKRPEQRTYYQHQPSQTLPPLSIWNNAITERDGKVVKRSYLQFPPSNVMKPSGLWNNVVTEKKKK